MGAAFSSLYAKIHYIEVRYIKVWVYQIYYYTLMLLLWFQFYKGLAIKASGEKKEGNKILRGIDSTLDFTEIAHDMNSFGNSLIRSGKESVARMLFQEGSKLHMFMSSYQRPSIRSDIGNY